MPHEIIEHITTGGHETGGSGAIEPSKSTDSIVTENTQRVWKWSEQMRTENEVWEPRNGTEKIVANDPTPTAVDRERQDHRSRGRPEDQYRKRKFVNAIQERWIQETPAGYLRLCQLRATIETAQHHVRQLRDSAQHSTQKPPTSAIENSTPGIKEGGRRAASTGSQISSDVIDVTITNMNGSATSVSLPINSARVDNGQ